MAVAFHQPCQAYRDIASSKSCTASTYMGKPDFCQGYAPGDHLLLKTQRFSKVRVGHDLSWQEETHHAGSLQGAIDLQQLPAAST